MPKRDPRAPRPPTDALPARVEQGSLLERILDTPHLARLVPRMPPEILHRVIQHAGLEDCGELVALATPGQLARVFDLDLWHAAEPGLDEQFDADRFGLWLEVMMESGVAVAAQKLSGIDAGLATAAFAQHVLVFDAAALSRAAATDDEELPEIDTSHDGVSREVGGYRIVGKRNDSWDAIVTTLTALEADHPVYFHRVMRGCRSLSNSAPELDGLDDLLGDGDQVMYDLAAHREERREQQGYVAPAEARAFLKMSRELPLGPQSTPPVNPVARAYFRAIEWTDAPEANSEPLRLLEASDEPPAPDDFGAEVAAFVDVLLDAGVLPQPPRALLDGPEGPAPRLLRIQAQMQFARDRDPIAFSIRGQELAFLANTILAGCSLQARPITAAEASDAAVAICNLGIENWPRHWALPSPPEGGHYTASTGTPDDFLVKQELTSVFQVGWAVLYRDVCMYSAAQLIAILKALRYPDRETQAGLNALRLEMTKHWKAGTPWLAREALDVMTILDMPSWAALLGLIDECPVMHAGLGAARARTLAVDSSAFEFISENSQIAAVRAFMQSLPETLRP